MNLSRIIEHWAGLTPAKCAIHFEGEDLPYAALWQRIDAATATLAQRFAVQPGERIAYLGLNHPRFIVLLMALARLGAMALPLNLRLAPPELAAILEHAGARLLLCDEAMHAAGTAAAAAAQIAIEPASVLDTIDTRKLVDTRNIPDTRNMINPRETIHTPETRSHQGFSGDDENPLLLVYSSGTTGRPKGAPHTQANLLWNIESAIAAQDLGVNDHLLTSLPMFHAGGLCIQLLPLLAAGGCVTLLARFEAGAWLRDVAARRPTLSLLVPAMLRAILDDPAWPGTDLSSLRFINTGSSVVPRALINAVHARGVPVSQVYGATETGPVSLVLRAEDALTHAGSVGKPALHVEVRLVRADGSDAATGETGEIWVRGKNVVAGYWNDPHNAAFADGWFHSGDVAYRDADGFYWVAGRTSELIISGGENIYPAELENILSECPLILEAAVVGEDDPQWGEVALAVVVPRPGAVLDVAAVLALFEGRIARYKHPRRVVFAVALPKTALGKVQRDLVKQQARAAAPLA